MQPNATKINIGEVILGMSVGEIIALPIEKTVNVRAYASQVGLSNGRKYRTSTHPEEQVVKVLRVK